jgi:surface protein
MFKIHSQIRKKKESSPTFKNILQNENGAIDLASIMVGIIVIGLIGGVIASTVFVVIPWTQDNAAKQQLDSVVSAESAYFGLSSDNPPALPAGSKPNTFGKSADLAAAKLMGTGPRYCVTTPDDGKGYTAYSQSSSGVIFTVTDKNTKATVLSIPAGSSATDSLPADCQFITDGITSNSGTNPTTPATPPYVDLTPTITKMTYKCDTGTSGTFPFNTMSQGTLTVTGDDGSTVTKTYTNVQYTDSMLLKAGVAYTVTFDGKYSWLYQGGSSLAGCIRSLDHWGEQSGVTKAYYGLQGASKLTSVPDHIPSTLTDLSDLFDGATILNDPNISKWDVSNVTKFTKMFFQATAFNQPLNNWNMSKADSIVSMFAFAYAFDQPLDKWNTSNVTDMAGIFTYAKVFNQNINSWDTSKATRMTDLFNNAVKFNQPLDKWNVSNVTKMDGMFRDTTLFNQDIGMWKPAKVTNMDYMFAYNTVFRANLSSWTFNVSPSRFAWAPTGLPTTSYPTF